MRFTYAHRKCRSIKAFSLSVLRYVDPDICYSSVISTLYFSSMTENALKWFQIHFDHCHFGLEFSQLISGNCCHRMCIQFQYINRTPLSKNMKVSTLYRLTIQRVAWMFNMYSIMMNLDEWRKNFDQFNFENGAWIFFLVFGSQTSKKVA